MKTKRKIISRSMLLYEFLNVTGNPFIHIFGIGMPALMVLIITRAAVAELSDAAVIGMIETTIFLGTGALVPMATILMGYASIRALEVEKGIGQRLKLFGVKEYVTLCNRAVSELIFMTAAFAVYFAVGIAFLHLEKPAVLGMITYFIIMLLFSVICFVLSHAIATITKKFGLTYCVTMLVYFACMILGGMMGITYENMPSAMQAVAKLLPVTYITRDAFTIWTGESYNFVPMVQAFLFFGAVAGILLIIAMKKDRKR